MNFPFPNMMPVEDEAHWHSLRARVIGSSDVPALFDYGYANKPSAWSVYAEKTGMIPHADLDDEDRVWIGKQMEPVIAAYVTRRFGYDLIDGARWHVVHPKFDFMGCTIDRFVVEHEDGIGIVETKNRDFLEFRDNYFDPKTGEEAPSLRDKIQVAHQFACLPEVQWGMLAVLVGGNDLKTFLFKREELADMIADIEKACADMHDRLIQGDEPDVTARELPDWLKAHQEAFRLEEPPQDIDSTTFDEDVETYLDADATAKEKKKIADQAKARVLQRCGEFKFNRSNRYQVRVNRSEVEEKMTLRKAHSRVTLKIEPFEGSKYVDPEMAAAAQAMQAPIE